MRKINKVCIANNLYCLLIFLLLADEKVKSNSFFFFSDSIPETIVKNFENCIKISKPRSRFGQFFLVLRLRLLIRIKYPFLKTAEIYGQDNLLISSPIIGNRKLHLIEDGVATYTRLPRKRKYGWIKRIIGGQLMGQETQGYSNVVDKIYLTGLAPIPERLSGKVEMINLRNLWDKSSIQKQTTIYEIFNLSNCIINDFKKIKSVLLTQPLSEDNVIKEEEKIELYGKIIKGKSIAIKPHPREKTNYANYFPNIEVLPSALPIELLSLAGVEFLDIYTIFSTAAFAFPNNPHLHFLGTNIHPAILERFGDVRLVDGVLKGGLKTLTK